MRLPKLAPAPGPYLRAPLGITRDRRLPRIGHPVRFSLASLAIAAIAAATAVPVELRSAVWWDGRFHAVDFLQNLLLYAPLGVALSGRSWRVVASSAAALSIAAEVVQLWSFERFSSPYDVLSNVLGACAGMWLWRRYRHARNGTCVVLRGSSVAVCVLASALAFVVWKVPRQSSEISGWNPTYGVLLGNESTGDRPWRGTIHAMRILAGALSPQQVSVLGEN